MKTYTSSFIILGLLICLLPDCKKQLPQEIKKPSLFITLKNDSGKSISGATVRLYKNNIDPGLIKISDSMGVVIFSDLDTAVYYWIAERGCLSNRVSQITLNRKLVPNVILYGYSVMAEAGVFKIINNSPEPYKVSDSLFNITVKKDSPYIAYRRARSYLIHSEKISTPGMGKDTLIKIKCNDTSFLRLPY